MTTREQRKLIRSKIEAGAAPQQVYDELHGQANAADEELADRVRDVPTLERRAQYRTQQWMLLGLLVLDVAWKLGVALPADAQKGWPGVVFQSAFTLVILLILWGVARFGRRAHSTAAIIAFLQLTYSGGPATDIGAKDVLMTVVFAAAAILGLYLQRKLTPDYIIIKEHYKNADGQARMRRVVRFGD
ncbi:MAG: hypothetical protein JST45_07430 [Bacteroidetes bacterium]|nr:hypothetical protein [Bacteroidota bacterium]